MKIPKLRMIVAINNLGYIGKGDGMPWNCSEDLKHFKNMTLNHNCIVGRKTYDIVGELPKRKMIVIGKEYNSPQQALKMVGDGDWVIGGATIYELFWEFCTELHISRINDNTVGDVKFPDLREFKGKIFEYQFQPN